MVIQRTLRSMTASQVSRSLSRALCTTRPLRSAPIASYTAKEVSLKWSDGHKATFDNQYLLDHCRCEKCFHPITKQRLKSLLEFPQDVKPNRLEATDDGLKIQWSTEDAHQSTFPSDFIRRASTSPQDESSNDDVIPWNASIAANPPTVSYESTKEDSGVLEWLDKVHKHGFCFVTGVPKTPEATEALIRRISHIRETHYGGFWDFTSNMALGDLAYSNQGLPAHTDTTYFTDPAGLQIFHMLSHPPPGTGGKSLLVDSFYAASRLSPKPYNTLSDLHVPTHASGTSGTLLRPLERPVLNHHNGELVQVRWNNEDRGVLRWDKEQIRDWYDAAREFEGVLKSKEAEYWVQLEPGTVVVIDNWRVMHGRSAFTGARRMCGAYIGADDWRSRRASLRRPKLGIWEAGW